MSDPFKGALSTVQPVKKKGPASLAPEDISAIQQGVHGQRRPLAPPIPAVKREVNRGAFRNFFDAFLLDNAVGQLAVHLANSQEFPIPESGDILKYDVFKDEQLEGYEEYIQEFAHSTSPEMTRRIIGMIERNRRLRTGLEEGEASWSHFIAGMADPLNLLPLPAIKGATMLQAFKRAAPVNAGVVAANELTRGHLDPTVDVEELAYGMGAGFLTAQGLVAGFAGVSRWAQGRNALSRAERRHQNAYNRADPDAPGEDVPLSSVARPTEERFNEMKGGFLFNEDLRYVDWITNRADDGLPRGTVRWRAVDGKKHSAIIPLRSEADIAKLRAKVDGLPDDLKPGERVAIEATDKKWKFAGRGSRIKELVENIDPKARETAGGRSFATTSVDAQKTPDPSPVKGVDGNDMANPSASESMAEALRGMEEDINAHTETVKELDTEFKSAKEARAAARAKLDEAEGKLRNASKTQKSGFTTAKNKAQKLLKEADNRLKKAQRQLEHGTRKLERTIEARDRAVAENDPDLYDLDPFIGDVLAEGASLSNQWPWYTLIKNNLRKLAPDLAKDWQRTAWRLAGSPGLYSRAARKGLGEGPSAEMAAKMWWARYREAEDMTDAIYAKYAGYGDNVSAGEIFWIGQKQKLGHTWEKIKSKIKGNKEAIAADQSSPTMTLDEFREQVGKAMMNNDQHFNPKAGDTATPHINEAARIWRQMFNRFEEEGIKLGVFATPERIRHRLLKLDESIARLSKKIDEYEKAELTPPSKKAGPEGEGAARPTEEPPLEDGMIRLYRGESPDNIQGGEWFTPDRALAERYGELSYVDVTQRELDLGSASGPQKDTYVLGETLRSKAKPLSGQPRKVDEVPDTDPLGKPIDRDIPDDADLDGLNVREEEVEEIVLQSNRVDSLRKNLDTTQTGKLAHDAMRAWRRQLAMEDRDNRDVVQSLFSEILDQDLEANVRAGVFDTFDFLNRDRSLNIAERRLQGYLDALSESLGVEKVILSRKRYETFSPDRTGDQTSGTFYVMREATDAGLFTGQPRARIEITDDLLMALVRGKEQIDLLRRQKIQDGPRISAIFQMQKLGLEVLHHEFGHFLEAAYFKNASESTKLAVMDDYKKWLDRNDRLPTNQIKAARHSDILAVIADIAEDKPNDPKAYQYATSWAEYMADMVGRTITEESLDNVDHPVRAFFKNLAESIKLVYAQLRQLVTGAEVPPDSIKKFLAEIKEGIPLDPEWGGRHRPDLAKTNVESPADRAVMILSKRLMQLLKRRERLVKLDERLQQGDWTPGNTDTAYKYFHRIWQHDRVVENEAKLKEILWRHFQRRPSPRLLEAQHAEDYETVLQAKVDDAYEQILGEANYRDSLHLHSHQNEITRLERRIELLREKGMSIRNDPEVAARMTNKEINRAGSVEQELAIIDQRIKRAERRLKAARKGEAPEFRVVGPSPVLGIKLDIPNIEIAEFIENDVNKVAQHYVSRMAPTLEISRIFGDFRMSEHLETLTAKLERRIVDTPDPEAQKALQAEKERLVQATEDLRDKVAGVFDVPEDPSAITGRTLRLLMAYNVLTVMGRSVLVALNDIGQAVAYNGFKRGLGGFVSSAFQSIKNQRGEWNLGAREVEMAGEAMEVATGVRFAQITDMPGMYRGMSRIEQWVHGEQGRFFLFNLMSVWTDHAKRFSGTMIQSRMIELSEKIANGTATEKEIRDMSAAGISNAMAKRIYRQWLQVPENQRKGKTLFLASTDQWDDQAAKRAFRSAMNQEINRLVITPGAADKPNIMSNDWGRVIGQYHSFSMAATQRLGMASLQRRDARALNAVFSMIALSLIIDTIKRPDYQEVDLDEQLFRAVELSGVTGILLDLNSMLEAASGNELGIRAVMGSEGFAKDPTWASQLGAAGAVPNQWLTLLHAFADDDASGKDQARAIRYMLPYNNLIWFNGLVSRVQKDAGDALEELQ